MIQIQLRKLQKSPSPVLGVRTNLFEYIFIFKSKKHKIFEKLSNRNSF
jgi:hypothetical protein